MADQATDDDSYLLGTSDAELLRLGYQHRVWAPECNAGWSRAGFGPGQHLLDLGCGPGFATIDLAYLVGARGQVTAIDESARFVEQVQQRAQIEGLTNITAAVGKAESLTSAAAHYDGIHLRWLLCFLNDGAALMRTLAQALKPGGRLLAFDYFNYPAFTLAPRSAAMGRVVQAIQDSWADYGASLDVQGNAGRWCTEAGLRVVSVRNESNIARPGTTKWRWPERFLEGYLPDLVARGFIDQPTVDAFWHDWRDCARTPGSFLFLPPLIELIAERVH